MFAIVDFRGEQYRIDSDMKQLRVAYMDGAEPGQAVTFDKVLLAGNKVGGSAKITGTVATHGRDGKIIVFKMKRKTQGHRQDFTMIDIKEFSI
jgi:large subunit ribosomal protein L21